jgi:anti-sigma factor RsiW
VNCQRLRQVLDARLDGELDGDTMREVDAHLADCVECATVRAARRDLRELLQSSAPSYAAPASLRRAVERAAGRERPQPKSLPRMGWLQAGALALATGLAGVALGIWLARAPLDEALRDAAVASHVASLASAAQLTMIASSDRHQLKPWFAGKLDFAPPVRDLSAEGFTLKGARLDHVGDRQAATIVYRVRNHDLSLFVWRAADGRSSEANALALVRGFGVATWAQDGLRFAAVSDVDQRDLERFVQLARATR